ncbi:MAG: plasmid mobilization protein [Steroidobacteraceae bacterium]
MSKRLQVVLSEQELEVIREDARRHGVTVSEWVRSALRGARRGSSDTDPARKLAAVRAAGRHSFPTGDIEQMLHEIERGYAGS